MLIFENLEDTILLKPARIDYLGCNSLKIITGFTDCDRIQTHFIALKDGMDASIFQKKIKVDIILGMTKGSHLTSKKHLNICKTLNRTPKEIVANCKYVYCGQEVHSKIYIWCKDDSPLIAFCGSANYSINAFHKRRECMGECNPDEAIKYYNSLLDDSVDCFDKSIESKISFSSSASVNTEMDEDNLENLSYEDFKNKKPLDIIKLSLLTNKGDVGYGSGINWGIRQNGTKRDRNQAYIPYNKNERKDGFFPLKNNPNEKNNPLFKVITEDDAFYMRIAQQGNKAIHSAENNAIIGKWFRKKLGVESGIYVTKKMLEDYGTTSVIFKKYDNNIYTLDFKPYDMQYSISKPSEYMVAEK